jgi:hypothetical protein
MAGLLNFGALVFIAYFLEQHPRTLGLFPTHLIPNLVQQDSKLLVRGFFLPRETISHINKWMHGVGFHRRILVFFAAKSSADSRYGKIKGENHSRPIAKTFEVVAGDCIIPPKKQGFPRVLQGADVREVGQATLELWEGGI